MGGVFGRHNNAMIAIRVRPLAATTSGAVLKYAPRLPSISAKKTKTWTAGRFARWAPFRVLWSNLGVKDRTFETAQIRRSHR